MGFINNEQQAIASLGINHTGCYYTFKAECSIRKQIISEEMKYCVYGRYYVYSSKQNYLDGKQPLDSEKHIVVNLDTLTNKQPLVELYNELKTSLNLLDITDDL